MIHTRNHLGLREKAPAWVPVVWILAMVVIAVALLARDGMGQEAGRGEAIDQRDLATTPQQTAFEFVSARFGLTRTPCIGGSGRNHDCILVRGRSAEPTVFVDEAPVLGGLDYLDVVAPHELYLVEVYGWGRHIRVYTNQFMERAAKIRLRPVALLF